MKSFLTKYQRGYRYIGGPVVFMALLLAGCSGGGSDKFKIEQAWLSSRYTTASGVDLGEANRVIKFYRDGSYAYFGPGGYNYGKWTEDATTQTIELKRKSGKLETVNTYWRYEVKSPKEMKVRIYREPLAPPAALEGTMALTAPGGKPDPDPFSPDMNTWREKPQQPEDLTATRTRVLQYLRFLEAVWTYAEKQQVATMPTSWFPRPILMEYSNGVRMAYANELDDWNECFYDSASAVKGYQYLSGALREIQLLETTNRFERNRDCIEQMIKITESRDLLQEKRK
ncbi:MAG: hypothetical protein MUF62_09560 [Chitinophagaceae bacterium]|nr:hypothetical protein [Chitinophagaceae bacterium]